MLFLSSKEDKGLEEVGASGSSEDSWTSETTEQWAHQWVQRGCNMGFSLRGVQLSFLEGAGAGVIQGFALSIDSEATLGAVRTDDTSLPWPAAQ